MEIWKEIEGYEDYQVSNMGRVRRKYRKLKGYKYLNPNKTEKGYLYVILYNHRTKKRKKLRVHRLVALAFIENPNNYPEVHHIDHNKENNNVNNLAWVTNKMNCEFYQEYKRENKGSR